MSFAAVFHNLIQSSLLNIVFSSENCRKIKSENVDKNPAYDHDYDAGQSICFVNTMFCYLLFGSVFASYSAYIFYITHDIIYTTDIEQKQKNTATNAKYFLRAIFNSSRTILMLHHRPPTRSVCVADCYFIVNVLDLPFASPIAIYR